MRMVIPTVSRVLAAAVAAVTLLPLIPAQAEAPPRVLWQAAPQFSDPLWLPLRRPAKVSCVRTNCPATAHGVQHGFWAIDFLGSRGDPIHAAGYGVAHVGARFSGCARGPAKRGNWVWVDHGAGEVTVYTHLDAITVREGQPVTPASVLGRMGTSGTCGTNYLHFERRRGGLHGDYLYPAAGRACLAGRQLEFPRVIGYRNWDSLPIRPRRRTVLSDGTNCGVAPAPVPIPAPPVVAHAGRSMATLRWNPAPGAGTTRYAVLVESFRRRTGTWRPPAYRFTARPSVVVRGLRPGTQYRFRVAACRAGANSPWSAARVATLAR